MGDNYLGGGGVEAFGPYYNIRETLCFNKIKRNVISC